MRIKVRRLNNIGKVRGLMFCDKVEPIYMETRFGLHTFFVKFPIDVVVLDDQSKVVKIKANLKPWRFLLWNPRYSKIIELPKGFVLKKKISVGDLILIDYV